MRPRLVPSAAAYYPGAATIYFAAKTPAEPDTQLVHDALHQVERVFQDDDDIHIHHETFAPRFATMMSNVVLVRYLDCLLDTMFYYRHHPDRLLTDDHSQREFSLLFTDPTPSLDVAILTISMDLASRDCMDAAHRLQWLTELWAVPAERQALKNLLNTLTCGHVYDPVEGAVDYLAVFKHANTLVHPAIQNTIRDAYNYLKRFHEHGASELVAEIELFMNSLRPDAPIAKAKRQRVREENLLKLLIGE